MTLCSLYRAGLHEVSLSKSIIICGRGVSLNEMIEQIFRSGYVEDAQGNTYQVENKIFNLAIEDWEIWERWQDAKYRGKTDMSTHPALPADRVRHEEIEAILSVKMKIDPDKYIICKARFEIDQKRKKNDYYMPGPLLVEWMMTKNKG